MIDSKSNFSFKMMIHTCQMVSDKTSLSMHEINNKTYIINHNARLKKRGYLYPIDVNRLNGIEIDNLTDFLIAIDVIRDDLLIEEWTFDRLDFAFDIMFESDDIVKYSLFFTTLFSYITGIKNAIAIKDINTHKDKASLIKNPFFEFQVYDKKLESNNRYPYTRFEFRFKSLKNKDIYSVIERLQKLLDGITDIKIQEVENQRINDLYTLWQKECQKSCVTQTKNFSEFVRRYSNSIITRNIAKGLYNKICTGNFNSWLKKFRRNNEIYFITKSEIKNIAREMKIALNSYLK